MMTQEVLQNNQQLTVLESISSRSAQRDWARDLAPFSERKLKAIIDISNKCNLRCRMCHFSFDEVFHRPAEHMRPEMFERLAVSILPNTHTLILSAGNEPLMSPWFVDILKIAAQYRVPELLFLTNAQLMGEKIAQAILDCGVTQVHVSIDGATKETYEYIRRGASFERLVRNIGYLTAQKRTLRRPLPLLQFNVVLMRRNLEELDTFVDLAETVGVDWIAARHLLMMKGLGMEAESLDHDHARANHYFRRFLDRVARSPSVRLIDFPDLFHMTASVHDPTPSDLLVQHESRSGSLTDVLVGPDASSHQAVSGRIPFGCVDEPSEAEIGAESVISFTGWSLGHKRIVRVTAERQAFDGDPRAVINQSGRVKIGEADSLNGLRGDVARAFPNFPHNYHCGWHLDLRLEPSSYLDKPRVAVHFIAQDVGGQIAEIGSRVVDFSVARKSKPYLFCSRPFDSIFIDSKGDVNPYPDCRPAKPFASIADCGTSIQDIWFSDPFVQLRQQIIDRHPPSMCRTCAHFINTNVNDSAYFQIR